MTLIDKEKLKICLTPFDMIKYDLTCEKIDYDNTETRRALWNMFDEAKHRTGFDAACGRICIRVYPEKSGGCQIYITKIDEKPSPSETDMSYNAKDIALPQTVRGCAVYSFSSLENMLASCRCLKTSGYEGESSAFFGDDTKRRYYLMINEVAPRYVGKCAYKNGGVFMDEFGKRCPSENAAAFLFEHCKPICEKNAVEILASLC